jgi:hypothetical protein
VKRNLLPLLFILLPFISIAQNQPQVLKDLDGTVAKITTAKKISEHVSILQTNVDDDNFSMIAVNDQLQVLWKTKLKGYAIGFGKYKDRLIAVAATNNSDIKGVSRTLNGFVIDKQTGKVSLQKQIYQGSEQYQELPAVYFNDAGSIFKLVVRQTAVERKSFTTTRTIANMLAVQDITITNFNEQLEPLTTVKPVIGNDALIGVTSNNKGDTFIAWLKDNSSVSIIKYGYGKTDPEKTITQTLDTRNLAEFKGLFINMAIVPLRNNNDVIFFGGVRSTNSDEMQVTACKFNFADNTHKITTELYDKDRFKSIEKTFNSTGSNLSNPHIGTPEDMTIRFVSEADGNLVIGISAYGRYTTANSFYQTEGSLLICSYDNDLKPKFQQVMPSGYSSRVRIFPGNGTIAKGTLYIVYNYMPSLVSMGAIYGALDLQTGQWKKMVALPRNNISSGEFADGNGIVWFDDSFIVPYADVHMLSVSKINILLQKNTY